MKRNYIRHLTALLLFGGNGIAASHISLQSYQIVLLRTLLGSMLLAALFFLTGHSLTVQKHPRSLLYLAISGIAMGSSWLLLYEAYAQIGVSISTLLYYCGPVIVMILSPLLFRERLTASKLLGFSAVLCGVLLINGQASGALNTRGILCAFLSAVMYSVMVMANKKSEHITGIENALLQLLSGFFTVAVFVGVRDGGYAMPIHASDWIWILMLGVLNTGVGCYLYFSSIGELPVQSVAVCGYLEPLSAVFFSAVFLRERLLPLQIVGAALILGGTVFGERFRKKIS